MAQSKPIPEKLKSMSADGSLQTALKKSSKKRTGTRAVAKNTEQETETVVGQDSSDVVEDEVLEDVVSDDIEEVADETPVEDGDDEADDGTAENVAKDESFKSKIDKLARYRHPLVTFPKGFIIPEGEPLTVTGKVDNNTVVVDQDIYRVFIPHNSKRPTFVLLYRKGHTLPITTVKVIDHKG